MRWWRGFGAFCCPWPYWRGKRWWWSGARYYPYSEITKEEEKEFLENLKKDLEAELEDINKRLEELK